MQKYASGRHVDKFSSFAVHAVLTRPDNCTDDEIELALRPRDDCGGGGVMGLPFSGWEWRLFADTSYRFPEKVQDFIKMARHVYNEDKGVGKYALKKVLLHNMHQLAETYAAKCSQRWAFIRVVTGRLTQKTSTVKKRKRL